ncbi:MAG: hypothetical protein Q8N38_10920 [Bacteroidales bacterium]|nr:hypothetical protein [Bacteroidales bacterium]
MKKEGNNEEKINGYVLSRHWFNFAFENPDKVNTNHAALFYWIVELCNRLGWKEKFGLPTVCSMEALGIKSYNTYKATLDDLIEFGFIKLITKSQNQYTSNIVALSNFNKAPYKALDKALTKHTTEQNDIYKQEKTIQTVINNEPFMSDAFSTDYTLSTIFYSLVYQLWMQCYDNRVTKKIKPIILQKAKPETWANKIATNINKHSL